MESVVILLLYHNDFSILAFAALHEFLWHQSVLQLLATVSDLELVELLPRQLPEHSVLHHAVHLPITPKSIDQGLFLVTAHDKMLVFFQVQDDSGAAFLVKRNFQELLVPETLVVHAVQILAQQVKTALAKHQELRFSLGFHYVYEVGLVVHNFAQSLDRGLRKE